MSMSVVPPTAAELEDALGSAVPIWAAIIGCAEATCAPIDQTWKPSKTAFGRMCLLQHRKRTLLYITPDMNRVWVAITLGERAFQIATSSPLPEAIRKLLLEAKPYAEGRGIRFAVASRDDLAPVATLLKAKTA